ncbi:expressed unknown protein [Seminavis robusta]|uniref:Uncharacterized protein n=1 Tax=Seminavis robusta TaxID=568900 RepID=A0A9N8DIZ5_9STRA|nr:expressed unknown protein [Seminavis robusta]|eukprot:Sro178_g078070.1 n/a (211) ;mRNA; f:23306-23938
MMRTADFHSSSSADWSTTMTPGEVSLSHYSMAQEPSNDFVLGSWQVEQHSAGSENGSSLPSYDDDDLMVVDSINMDFDDHLEDDYPPTPPADRLFLEEALEDTLLGDGSDHEDDSSFFTTHSQPLMVTAPATSTSFLPYDQRYQATLDKLAESMKKSQETRKSLRIKTCETMEYSRWNTVSGTLTSIEKSTQQLQQYLKNKKPATAQQVL